MNTQEFEKRMAELQNIIVDGIVYFTAWRTLSDLDNDMARALNRYKGLFLPTQLSLKNMALLQFSKIFDCDARTSSLRNLLTVAIENQKLLTSHAKESDLQNIKRWIDDNENLLDRLKRFRNKRIAHHDSIYTRQSLLFGEVKKLVDEVQSMFNLLRFGHDRSTTSFEYIVKDTERHTSQVIQIIREERDRDIKAIKDTRK